MQENRTLVFEVSSGKRRIAHTAQVGDSLNQEENGTNLTGNIDVVISKRMISGYLNRSKRNL